MPPETIDKYLYIEKTPTWLVKTIYIIGILTWLSVIYGYARFIKTDPVYWWILFPFLCFFTLYYLNSYGINLFYKRLDLKKHFKLVENFWKKSKKERTIPNVDIFLPICGESSDVIETTFRAVSRLNYLKKKVYVLDDKGIDEHRRLAKTFGFTYFSRENKGEMKKAGNIKHGYERSKGDFIAIFDADFAPHPDFIKELLPYMSDPQVAIVQSPQYFQTDGVVHKRSSLEYGASQVQEDFYRFIQVARSRLGAPICCGSNAIYRRKALDSIGGTTQIEHSEDMHTGFDLTNKGWRVKYIPIILATGLCPDNLHQYFHQQHRWCSGSLSLMLSKKFWASRRLTFAQRMCFISGFLYYLSYPITIIISLQAFVVLFRYSQFISFSNSFPFLPCIIFCFIVMPLFRIAGPRFGNFYARTAYGYAYCHAVVSSFIKTTVGWQPTNAKKMTISKAYRDLVLFNAAYLALYVGLIGIAIHRNQFQIFNPDYYSVLFWILFNLFGTIMILSQFYLVIDDTMLDQVEESKLSVTSLQVWRLRTVGMYLALLTCILILTIKMNLI